MTTRTGSADLPLHGGHVPQWLAQRMASLGRIIIEAIAHHYGRDEVLRRLAHPFWFQSFGAVMGMDWHSSGITTSVLGALKRGLRPLESELGLYVCGGRGRHSRRTPAELARVGDRTGLDAAPLARASRLVAKVDSAAVQDGYELYLHSFVVSADGRWCVVQQGMNPSSRTARRYHWLSEQVTSFVDSPHAAIEGPGHGTIVNLADVRAARSRAASLELVQAGPERTISVLRRSRDATQRNLSLFEEPSSYGAGTADTVPRAASYPHLQMPAHHDVRLSDIVLKRLHGTLAAAAERGPHDFEELLLSPGVGQRTVAALAFVAEVVHGSVARFSDPARFSLAHGGKDGHPFPVPLLVYDETIRVLKEALARARLGNRERLEALQRLDQQARTLERTVRGPTFKAHLERERASSAARGGRTVFLRKSSRR
jgi:uncharacterized protein